jgi:hypothetical protein
VSAYTNTQDIAAKKTEFDGIIFRSRLEARWAVFFDLCGINWQYEPQCFEKDYDDCVIQYLPDFYLPDFDCWAEVKGTQNNLNSDWDSKMRPILDYYPSPIYETADTSRGFLILGELPNYRTNRFSFPAFTFIQHHEGLWHTKCSFQRRKNNHKAELFIHTISSYPVGLSDIEYPQLEPKYLESYRIDSRVFTVTDIEFAFDEARRWNFITNKWGYPKWNKGE